MTNSESQLPERINVIRTVTYHVPDVVLTMKQQGKKDLSIEKILDFISGWVEEDMASWPSRHDLVYQDENGEEI